MRLSVIIPTLNEAGCIVDTLATVQPLRSLGHQLILADGGSSDSTVSVAESLVDRVVIAPQGRAAQMNVGAEVADGDILLFLHADTHLCEDAEAQLHGALRQGANWGRFNVRLSGSHPLLRVIEWMMNRRSCLTGIATGDQAMFVERRLFQRLGGFPAIPLMEDITLSAALKRSSRPACLAGPVVTSSRRWEEGGIARTVLLMWRLRLSYFLGTDPARLARSYRTQKSP